MIKTIQRYKLNIIRLVFLLLFVLAATEYIAARPGGGSGSRSRSSGGGSKSSGGGGRSSSKSSSGGGYSSNSSSGGGYSSDSSDGEVAIFVIISFLIIVVVIGVFAYRSSMFVIRLTSSLITGKPMETKADNARIGENNSPNDIHALSNNAKRGLYKLQANDINFSQTLFLDYAQNVYHQYYSRLDKDTLSSLLPFFVTPPEVNPDFSYTEIVINAMHIVGVGQTKIDGKDCDKIDVLLETNFTQTDTKSGKKERFLSEEEWSFVRQMKDLNGEQVLSLVPAKMQALSCPSCGAGESFHGDLKCRACGTSIAPAAMQWAVAKTKLVYEESYVTNALISYAEEVGTGDATIIAPNLQQTKAEFAALHSIENIATYDKKFITEVVRPAFVAIYTAWTKRDLQPVRHLISDFLYQTQQFWIEEYKNQGLTNQLDNLEVGNVELVKIDIDKYYETLTVRIFAGCRDYTTKDETGKVVGGNKDKIRVFSEYWTFVRRVGMEKQPKDSLDLASCPSCSAPLDKMGQAGTCGYCSNKISTGEFSWVLSRITQDEAYA